MNHGDRIVITEDPDRLVVGWEGMVLNELGGLIEVWLDQDDYPSTWYRDQLKLLHN